MTFKEPVRRVDQSAIGVNQAFIAALLLEAFLLNSLPLVAFVALVMLAGAASPSCRCSRSSTGMGCARHA